MEPAPDPPQEPDSAPCRGERRNRFRERLPLVGRPRLTGSPDEASGPATQDVELRLGRKWVRARLVDLSGAGMGLLLHGTRCPDRDEAVFISFQPPTSSGPLEISAVVRHACPAAGGWRLGLGLKLPSGASGERLESELTRFVHFRSQQLRRDRA